MRPQEVLSRAADAIEEHGWTQGNSGNTQIGFCISGAMMHVGFSFHALDRAYDILCDRLGVLGCHPTLTRRIMIPKWNDEPGRTKEQVVTMLRELASSLESWRR